MPAASPDADAGLTVAEIQRRRSVAMLEEFSRYLSEDRQLDPGSIGFGMLLVGIEHLRIDPTNEHDLALARALATALDEILSPVERRTN